MANTPLESVAFYQRRARGFALLAASLSTLVVVIALFGHPDSFSLTIYVIAAAGGWTNALVQHRALRATLSNRPANER